MPQVTVPNLERMVLALLAEDRRPEGLRVRDLAREAYGRVPSSPAQNDAVRKALRRLEARGLVEQLAPPRSRGEGWSRWPRYRLPCSGKGR
jgi:hypothetical protein